MNQGSTEQTFDKLFKSLDSLKENIEVISTQFKDNVCFSLFIYRPKLLLLLSVFLSSCLCTRLKD